MTDPKQIAASLTKAQRALVLASGPDDMTGEDGCGVEIRAAQYRTARSLHAMGLGSYTHGSPLYDMYWNFPLGQQVRDIIKEQENG